MINFRVLLYVTGLMQGIFLATLPAATFTWSGLGATTNWSDSGNWVGGDIPTNDGLAEIVFGGGPLNVEIDGTLLIKTMTTGTGAVLNFSGATGNSLLVSGAISSGTQISKQGDFSLLLAGSNPGLGNMTITGGLVNAQSANSIGFNSGNQIAISGTGVLGLSNGYSIPYPPALVLNGLGNGSLAALHSLAGSTTYNNYNGAITLAGNSSLGASSGVSLSLQQSSGNYSITGVGDLHVVGDGLVNIYQRLGFAGDFHVDSGKAALYLNPNFGGDIHVHSGAILRTLTADALTTGTGTTHIDNGGTLEIGGGILNAPIEVSGNGVNGVGAIQLNGGYNSGVGSVGPMTLLGDTRFGIVSLNNNNNSSANQLGNIGGTGNVEFVGAGTVNLLAGNTYGGETSIAMGGGYLRVDDLSAFGFGTEAIMVNGGTLDFRDTDFNYAFDQEAVVISGPRAIALNGGAISGSKFDLAADVVLLADGTISGANGVLSGSITGDGRRLTLSRSGYESATVSLDVQGSITLGGGGVTIASASIPVIFSSTNIFYTGATIVQGVLREGLAGALPSSSNLQLAGTASGDTGILELGGGDFAGQVGTGPGQVGWAGSGGFAAFGASRVVNLGGAAATMGWGTTSGFLGDGQVMKLGMTTSTDSIELVNGLDLGGQTRSVSYASGIAGEAAELSGDISNGVLRVERRTTSSGGKGYLTLSGSNTFSGLEILAPVRAEGSGLPVSANINFAGGNTSVLLLSADLSHGLGSGAGQVQWTGSGGFAAIGQDVTVNLVPSTLTWGSGAFVPTGQVLVLGSDSADHTVTLADNIALGSVDRTILVNRGLGSGADGVLSGVISGSGGLTKSGLGNLVLTGANTFTGDLNISAGVLETDSMGGDIGSTGALGKGQVILSGGTFRYTRSTTGSSNRFGSGSLAGSASLEITDAATDLELDSKFTSTSEYNTLTKLGPGAITLSTGSSNTNLNIAVSDGRVDLAKTGSAYAVENLTINGGSVRLDGSSTNQINGELSIGSGAFLLNGHNETVSALSGYNSTASIQNGSTTASRLTVDSEYDLSYWGGFTNGGTGSLGLTKTGAGRLRLSGTNAHSGSTLITEGQLDFMTAASVSANSNVVLDSFATLGLGFDWAPTLGTGAGQFRWATNAFDAGLTSAVSGGASLSIGGTANPTKLKFGATNFVRDNYGLIFGSQYAAGTLNLRNPLDFNAKTQLIGVYNQGSVAIEGELSGVISNGTGLNVESIAGTANFSLIGGNYNVGRIAFTANNTFDGPVNIDRVGVVIDRIGNIGSGAGPLGLASTAAKGVIALESYGELRYTGTGHSTDRAIYLGATSTYGPYDTSNALVAEGSGALVWNGDITNLYSGATQSLYLSGSSTAANEIGGDILPYSASTDKLRIFKQGSGTWVLSGNTNLELLQITDTGRIELRGNHNFTSNISTFDASTLVVGGAITTGASFYELLVNTDARLRFVDGFGFAGPISYYQDGATPGNERFVVSGGDTLLSGKTTIVNSGLHRFTVDEGASLTFDTLSGNAIEGPYNGRSVAFGGGGDFIVNDAISLVGTSTFTFDGMGSLTINASNTMGAAYLEGGETFANTNQAFGVNEVIVRGGAVLAVSENVRLSAQVRLENGGVFQQTLASGADLTGLGAQLEVAPGVVTNAQIRSGTTEAFGEVSLTMNLDAGGFDERLRAILNLTGTGNAVIALSMQVGGVLDAESYLAWASNGQWLNAVAGNTGSGVLAGNYLVGWDAFVAAHSGSTLDDMLGAYGLDAENGEVWAVINHNSEFQIVPEPSACLLFVGGSAVLWAFRRRRF